MIRLRIAILVCLISASCVFGQRAAEIESKYGKPTNVYSLSEHIWMTPEFAADGKVCEMRLYPKRIDGSSNYLSKKLPFEELSEVLNEMIPVDQRGNKELPFGLTDTGRPAAWTTYGYEKVTFTFISAFSPSDFVDSPAMQSGGNVFQLRAPRPESRVPSKDDFRSSQRSAIEIVRVKWNDRKCGGR
jgi:hypothetical protein